jgi:hypothetical protein
MSAIHEIVMRKIDFMCSFHASFFIFRNEKIMDRYTAGSGMEKLQRREKKGDEIHGCVYPWVSEHVNRSKTGEL